MNIEDQINELKKQLAELEELTKQKPKKKRGRPKKNKDEPKPVILPTTTPKRATYVPNPDDKFMINNGESGFQNGKDYGRKESLTNVKFKNTFNPKKEVVKQEAFDKKVVKKVKPTERNRQHAPKQIEVSCDKCSKRYMAFEDEVNIMVPGDDEPSSNICIKCIRNSR